MVLRPGLQHRLRTLLATDECSASRRLIGALRFLAAIISLAVSPTLHGMDPTLQAAWVAVAGTLLGSLVGGGIQTWTGRRALASTHDDAAAQRGAAANALEMQLSEERLRRLWSERRALYTAVLAESAAWDTANTHAHSENRYNFENAESMRDPEEVTPQEAAILRCMPEFRRLEQEVHLIGGTDVREAMEPVRRALYKGAAAAADCAPSYGNPEYIRALDLLTLAMRRELIDQSGAGLMVQVSASS